MFLSPPIENATRKTVKSVFDTLYNLNNQEFQTWISKAYELSWSYDIDMDSCTQLTPGQFKHICHERMKSYFVSTWLSDLRSGDTSIARTSWFYKSSFGTECYLKSISNPKLRVPLSKLRASSRDLEIERGRYVRPKWNIGVCPVMLLRTRNILLLLAKTTR